MTHHHETTDFEPRYAVYFGVGLSIAVILVCLGLWIMFDFLVEQEQAADLPPSLVRAGRIVPPEPRLQVAPEEDNYRKADLEAAALERYEWIDRDGGRARIPIDRAMEILIERGAEGNRP